MLTYAVDGTVVTTWDPILDDVGGARPHALDALRAKVAADNENDLEASSMLGVIGHLTGVVVATTGSRPSG